MDIGRNNYGEYWRAVGRKVKIGKKLYKKVKKPAAKLMKKAFGSVGRMFSSSAPAIAVQRHDGDGVAAVQRHDDVAFMTCILTVKSKKQGWEKSILALLKNCRGVRFQMDQDGRVEVNGIANPDKVLRKIAKSKKVELQWIQFGQCSGNLFMQPPEPPPKKDPSPSPPPPPIQHNNFPAVAATGSAYHPYPYSYPYPIPPRIFY